MAVYGSQEEEKYDVNNRNAGNRTTVPRLK